MPLLLVRRSNDATRGGDTLKSVPPPHRAAAGTGARAPGAARVRAWRYREMTSGLPFGPTSSETHSLKSGSDLSQFTTCEHDS